MQSVLEVAPQAGHAAPAPALPQTVLRPSARSAFTHAPAPAPARSSSPASGGSTPRQALQISSLVS